MSLFDEIFAVWAKGRSEFKARTAKEPEMRLIISRQAMKSLKADRDCVENIAAWTKLQKPETMIGMRIVEDENLSEGWEVVLVIR